MADAPRYASVTSITGLLPKNLTWWAGNAVADCAFHQQADWLTMDEFTAGKTTYTGRQARYEYVRRAHQRIKETAADLGSEVHRFVEARNLDKPTPIYPLPVRARMAHFADFMDTVNPRVEAAETKVYHRGERGGRSSGIYYAGTLDMLAEVDGRMAVLDIKTGKSVWPEAGLQINAYAYADFLVADPHHPGARQITPNRGKRWYEWHGTREDEIAMPDVQVGYVLHLRDDGWDLHEVPISDDLYDMFLSLFPIDRWEREVKKNVLTRVMGSQPDDRLALADQAIAEFGGKEAA